MIKIGIPKSFAKVLTLQFLEIFCKPQKFYYKNYGTIIAKICLDAF